MSRTCARWGLRKYMPITYITSVIGTLALVGTPFFSGFYSKDTIIEVAAHHAEQAHSWVATYAYWAVLGGVLVTSFYSFRLLFLTFHGEERFRRSGAEHAHGSDAHVQEPDGHEEHAHGVHEPHESPWVVTLPLILLAIPSITLGFFTIGPMLFGTDWAGHHAVEAIRVRLSHSLQALLIFMIRHRIPLLFWVRTSVDRWLLRCMV